MAVTRAAFIKIRLSPDQRNRLSELAKASGQAEENMLGRAVELFLAIPDLTPESVAQLKKAVASLGAEVSSLKAELGAAQRHVEQLTTRLQVDWQAAVQARQEERRAAAEAEKERRWSLFRRKEG
ncbi:MAG TPA: hypothetical protein VD902_01920 [Symbiobacteriaceae bacterium]|nr:hypothetical protein [Symbiobacteriaceae bacterium]